MHRRPFLLLPKLHTNAHGWTYLRWGRRTWRIG